MYGPVMFLGQGARLEFVGITARLHAAHGGLVQVTNVREALAAIEQVPNITHVVVAPAYRQEFPESELRQLLARQPLAQWWLLVGPWLEGETRSGHAWVGARRLYVDQAHALLGAATDETLALDALSSGWIPSTLTPEERWLSPVARWPTTDGLVLVCGELPDDRHGVEAICRAMGLRVVGLGLETVVEADHVDSVVYDAPRVRARWPWDLRRLASLGPRHLVALVNFPRSDEVEGLLAAGATAVLGKPFDINHLVSCLGCPRRPMTGLLP